MEALEVEAGPVHDMKRAGNRSSSALTSCLVPGETSMGIGTSPRRSDRMRICTAALVWSKCAQGEAGLFLKKRSRMSGIESTWRAFQRIRFAPNHGALQAPFQGGNG